jgi:protein-S-isoprenylcysteine O-methyltransferase Ste14
MQSHALWNEVNGLWLIFAVYFVASIRRLRIKSKSPVPVVSMERGALALGALLIFSPVSHLSFLALRFPGSRPVATSGLYVVIVGLAFAAWARDILGKNWSSAAVIQVNHQLITAGPYAYVRHPLYTGLIIALAGTVLVEGECGAILGWILITSVFRLKAQREERLLEGEFGRSYSEYSSRTGRLLPRLSHV